MTQGEIKAFWSGVAATSKGKILVGAGSGGTVDIERITEEEIDEILALALDWAETHSF